MPIDITIVVYALVFLGALIAFEGSRQLVFGHRDPNEVASRRMQLYKKGVSSKEVLQKLRRPPEQPHRLSFTRSLNSVLGRAGLTISVGRFLFLCFGGALFISFLVQTILGPVVASAILLIALIVPQVAVRVMAAKRGDKLVKQLPDALDKMARGLKVGHPLNITLANVARETPDPLGTEVGILVDQVTYGDELITAIRELADRVDLEDVHFFAVAVGIQHGTGGNLSRILSTLSRVIRDRSTMRRRIRAISSEGRMTMYFMTCLPPGVALVMNLAVPSFFGDVADDPLFIPAMGLVALLTTLNFLALRKLVNFRV